MSEMLSTAEAARLCDMGKSTLQRRAATGYGPPFVMWGAKRMFYRDGLLEWAARDKRHGPQKAPSHSPDDEPVSYYLDNTSEPIEVSGLDEFEDIINAARDVAGEE